MAAIQDVEAAASAGPAIAEKLLAWYGREGRSLPWRIPPGADETPDPYKVWLSEVMLQQTTVKAVLPRYGRFLRRWPRVEDLAAAPLGDVLAEWAGLGYYARARNLHACAVAVAEEHGGRFPATEAGLKQLPGIGDYTAAAIAAIAFNEPAAPVDGNIERVMTRLFALKTPLPEAKPEIKALAASLTPKDRPGDFAQCLMDLGAQICTPKRPACGLCPIRADCAGYAEGLAEVLPYKAAKAERPTRLGTAFVSVRQDGAVLLRERPPKGLLGGMLEVPSTPWEGQQASAPLDFAPLEADWRKKVGLVEHTFTHFHLKLEIYAAEVAEGAALSVAADPGRCRWVARRDLADAALPSLMRKVLRHGLGE
ncbi:putative A/G-specific adenine glycosylase YfhQ [Methyloligella halotolerans]|uniref:Adenine DNA glycosylase n=1 Tax=Methyloligella halotolerans TaxID=1177755 RepID=A0A1E2RYE0_9HYPH|nr:A/G-specific adenine glycosylase [Methyloligella halotolerans]ODA67256.1 putative A/G-specific adenine glycosylase YfhQ [Methyloligella halotolerans]